VIKTRVKALLEPKPLKELKDGKDFIQVNEVHAAAGIKIAAPCMENVVPGMPVRAIRNEKDISKAVAEVEQEKEEVEIETDNDGALLKADTLGSLEALIKTFKGKIPVKRAKVGPVTKNDVMEMKTATKPMVFSFCLKTPEDVSVLAKDNNVRIFSSNVIYTLIEDHKKWEDEIKLRWKEELLKKTNHPGRIKVIRGYVFRQSKPAIFGAEVLLGTIRTGSRMVKNKKIIGEINEIQSQGENKSEAKMGDKIAISMPDVTIGKHVNENDTLDVFLSNSDRENLEKVRDKLRPDELELLDELKEN
ncbi:MAG: translation initiation factor IF-2, partial [Candidatus Aenigmatarchaeota archaeon]